MSEAKINRFDKISNLNIIKVLAAFAALGSHKTCPYDLDKHRISVIFRVVFYTDLCARRIF